MNALAVKSLKRVRTMFLAGQLGAKGKDGCIYHQPAQGNEKERFCAIGCLFNKAQIADIETKKLNDIGGVYSLADHIGKKNIEAVTGLKMETLEDLQWAHDSYAQRKDTRPNFLKGKCSEFVKFLDEMITDHSR